MSSSTPGPSKQTLNPYQPFPTTQKNVRRKFTSVLPFIPTFVEGQLSKAKNIDPKAVYANRVKGKHVLLENPSQHSTSRLLYEQKKARRANERERKEPRLISKKEAKVKGHWKLEGSQKTYGLFVPLHHLWLGYMSELLGLPPLPTKISDSPSMPNSAAMHAKLVKADFHGSVMTVKQAKNPCLVGLSGIVIHETENAFKVISIKSQVKLIPKQGTIFVFRIPLYDIRSIVPVPSSTTQDESSDSSQSPAVDLEKIPQMEFELHGNQFRFRAAERAGRKFKAKETIEL